MTEVSKSFWVTIPGILTGLAALITAIGGIVIAFNSSSPTPKPIDKIIGSWVFTMHSDLSGITYRGTLNLLSDEVSGENNIRGRIITYNTDWNNFSSDVKGIFVDNQLKIYREIGIENIIQYYDLNYYSGNKLIGTFHNSSNTERFKDTGTFDITR